MCVAKLGIMIKKCTWNKQKENYLSSGTQLKYDVVVLAK